MEFPAIIATERNANDARAGTGLDHSWLEQGPFFLPRILPQSPISVAEVTFLKDILDQIDVTKPARGTGV